MNDTHEPEHPRGWGHGLAAWILAAYTNPGDTVLDLDDDPAIRVSAAATGRNVATPSTPGVRDSQLVTATWPRPHGPDAVPLSHREAFAEIERLLAPSGRLGLVMSLPALSQPFTLHTGDLLAAALDAGLGHLRAVHAVAVTPVSGLAPTYRCALIFRRPGRRADRGHDKAEPTRG